MQFLKRLFGGERAPTAAEMNAVWSPVAAKIAELKESNSISNTTIIFALFEKSASLFVKTHGMKYCIGMFEVNMSGLDGAPSEAIFMTNTPDLDSEHAMLLRAFLRTEVRSLLDSKLNAELVAHSLFGGARMVSRVTGGDLVEQAMLRKCLERLRMGQMDLS
jgi:hypothetical protein